MFNFTKPAIGYSVSHFIIIGMLGLAASNAKASSIAPVKMLEIRDCGIGPLNGQTHFNQQEIQKLLPGFKVTAGVGAFEDQTFPTLLVSDAKGLLLTINPDGDKPGEIYSIIVETNRLPNSLGDKLGSTYGKVYRGFKATCVAQLEQLEGTMLCEMPQSQHISYLFEHQQIHSGKNGIPPQKIIETARLKNIVWKP